MHIFNLLRILRQPVSAGILCLSYRCLWDLHVLGRIGSSHRWEQWRISPVSQAGYRLIEVPMSDVDIRAAVFIALGCSGFAPMIHALLQHGLGGLENFPISHVNLSSLLYLTGTTFYVTRTPEKIWPGVFDVWVSPETQLLPGNILSAHGSPILGCESSDLPPTGQLCSNRAFGRA